MVFGLGSFGLEVDWGFDVNSQGKVGGQILFDGRGGFV